MHLHFQWPDLLWCVMPKVGNTQVLTGEMMSLSAKLRHHQSCCLWSTSWQLLLAYIIGEMPLLSNTQHPLSCSNAGIYPAGEFREILGCSSLAEVEAGWCREYTDLDPTVLSSGGPPDFRMIIQGPSRHGNCAERGMRNLHESTRK